MGYFAGMKKMSVEVGVSYIGLNFCLGLLKKIFLSGMWEERSHRLYNDDAAKP